MYSTEQALKKTSATSLAGHQVTSAAEDVGPLTEKKRSAPSGDSGTPKKARVGRTDSGASTPKVVPKISKSDLEKIKSYFDGISVDLDVNNAEKMDRFYCYSKFSTSCYYKLELHKDRMLSTSDEIELTRYQGEGILIACKVEESPGEMDKVLQINAKEQVKGGDASIKKALASLLEAQHFQKVADSVKAKGYWGVPEDVLQRLPALASFDEISVSETSIPSMEVCQSATALFEASPFMLEKFCRLKIRELIHYADSETHNKASTAVKMSIITEDKQVSVVDASVCFDKDKSLAITLVGSKPARFDTLLEALNQSDWLQENTRDTHIRFANVVVEKDVALCYFLSEKIEYGLLPDEIEKKASKQTQSVNFWEAIAYKRKKREPIDWRELDELESQLIATEAHTGEISFTKSVNNLANFREDIQQKGHIAKILQNQRFIRGTLLHLPTGFGKTFIMFMAMAEHRNNLSKAKMSLKPYLVVVKAKNVSQSWDDNLESLNNIMAKDASYNIFNLKGRERAEILNFHSDKDADGKAKDFLDYCLSAADKPEVIVAVTCPTLKIAVDSIFMPTLLTDKKNSAIFDDFLEVLIQAEMLSEKGYIIGGPSSWESRLQELVDKVNEKIRPLIALIEEGASIGEQKIIDSAEAFFYPRGRKAGSKVNKASLDLNRRKFSLEVKKAAKLNIFDQLSMSKKSFADLSSGLCGRDEFTQAEKEDLFNLISLYYRFKCLFAAVDGQGNVDLKKLCLYKVVGEKNISALLSEFKQKQNQAVAQYQQLKNCFSGLIIDESDQALVVPKSSAIAINVTSILLDLSKYYQSIATVGSDVNPLVIAASATPWPNDMSEFSLHMQFLLPKLIAEHATLHDELFKVWNSFDDAIDCKSSDRMESAFKSRNVIEQSFQRWVRMLFRVTVAYAAPQRSVTNVSEEKIVYVECRADIYDMVRKVKNEDDKSENSFLMLINNFYAGVLKTTVLISADPKTSGSIFHSLIYGEKNAFFVRSLPEAALLAVRITEYFTAKYKVGTDEVQIGFFYEDNFVRKPSGVPGHYKNVTYNINRKFNRNAFNNIVRLDDFYIYVKQYLRDFGNAIWPKAFSKINLIENIGRCELSQLVNDLEKNVVLFFPSSANRASWSQRNEGERKDILGKFISFLKMIVDLERYSEENLIIDFFDEELKKFELFLPAGLQKQKDLKKGFYDFRVQYAEEFDKFARNAGSRYEPYKENGPMADNPFQGFIYQFLHYLIKICQSNFFIFGDAGTSGMRIDADRLVVLSGAWSEGRLTQVKGRVGRAKGNENRKCIIYLPVSNTLFEYLILRYYVKKSHYDNFITRKTAMRFREIAEPLVLAREIARLYQALTCEDDAAKYIDGRVHESVRKIIAADANYLALDPYDKAMKIVPDSVLQALAAFAILIAGLPALAEEQVSGLVGGDSPVTLGAQSVTEWLSEHDDECWGEEFSKWIALYAECNGWLREANQHSAGSILSALLRDQNIEVTQAWYPTDIVLSQQLSTSVSTVYTPGISGLQSESYVLSPVVHLNVTSPDGHVTIDTEVLEDSLKKMVYTVVKDFEAKKTVFDYATTNQTVAWQGDMPDELYVELSAADNKVDALTVEALTINGNKYALYGELAGGNNEGITHFWTYRSGRDVCYRIDDVKNHIEFQAGKKTPRDPQSRIFRFVVSGKLPELESLRPKRLINRNSNCYINAAFQLADSKALRDAIIAFRNQQLPNLPIDSVKLLSADPDCDKETPQSRPLPPTIHPYQTDQYAYSSELLGSFVNAELKQIILILPTRGVTKKTYSDGRIDGDFDSAVLVNHLVSMLDASHKGYQILLILGLNVELADVSLLIAEGKGHILLELDSLLAELDKVTRQGRVLVIPAPFVWQSKDRFEDKPPLGQMRNYCLELATSVYKDLIGELKLAPDNVAFMSMDGDTQLTARSFAHMTDNSRCYRHTIKTGGYEMIGAGALDKSKEAISGMTDDEWSMYWTRFVNHVSNEISARLTVNSNNLVGFGGLSRYFHFGYCSEPVIYLTPLLTEKLFKSATSFLSFKSEYAAPFGFWDNEGRRFRRYLNDIFGSDSVAAIDMLGPAHDEADKRPMLCSYERFEVPAPSHRKLKQTLTKDELAWVIKNMYRQPQHLIKPWFTGSNIAVVLKVRPHLIRGFASYFYIKSILLLLNLGPGRAYKFCHYLHKRFLDPSYLANEGMIKEFNCGKEAFMLFVNNNFFDPLKREDDASLEFRKYATILALWSRMVTEVLKAWFTEYFEAECDRSTGCYLPMALPAEYPKEAVDMVNEDEVDAAAQLGKQDDAGADVVMDISEPGAQALDMDGAIAQINSYFEAASNDDYIVFENGNSHVVALCKISSTFKELAVVKGRLVLFIDKTKVKGLEAVSHIVNLLTYVTKNLELTQQPVSLCMDFCAEGKLLPRFETLDDQEMLTSDQDSLGSIFSKSKLLEYMGMHLTVSKSSQAQLAASVGAFKMQGPSVVVELPISKDLGLS